MEQNEQKQQFQCTGDCLNCIPVQRQYCASQHSYNTLRLLQQMQTAFDAMVGEIEQLKEKIESIQNNEALVFDPNNTAQDGSGAGE